MCAKTEVLASKKDQPEPPDCGHNDWDNLRVKNGKTHLRCRVCDVKKRTKATHEKCVLFPKGKCEDPACTLLHIHAYKSEDKEKEFLERTKAKAELQKLKGLVQDNTRSAQPQPKPQTQPKSQPKPQTQPLPQPRLQPNRMTGPFMMQPPPHPGLAVLPHTQHTVHPCQPHHTVHPYQHHHTVHAHQHQHHPQQVAQPPFFPDAHQQQALQWSPYGSEWDRYDSPQHAQQGMWQQAMRAEPEQGGQEEKRPAHTDQAEEGDTRVVACNVGAHPAPAPRRRACSLPSPRPRRERTK